MVTRFRSTCEPKSRLGIAWRAAEKIIQLLTLLTLNVWILPAVIYLQKSLSRRLLGLRFSSQHDVALLLFEDRAELVMVIDVHHVHSVSDREGAIAANDQHVFIICVRGFESEVVAAGYHRAVFFRKRIDNHDLVMNDKVGRFAIGLKGESPNPIYQY